MVEARSVNVKKIITITMNEKKTHTYTQSSLCESERYKVYDDRGITRYQLERAKKAPGRCTKLSSWYLQQLATGIV